MSGYGPNGIYNEKGKCVRVEGSLNGLPHSRRKRPMLRSNFKIGKARSGGSLLSLASRGRSAR